MDIFCSNDLKFLSYRDFREPYDSPNRYELTMEFYVILGARLAFVVVFEVNRYFG